MFGNLVLKLNLHQVKENTAILYGLPEIDKFMEDNSYSRNISCTAAEGKVTGCFATSLCPSLFLTGLFFEKHFSQILKKICYINFTEDKDESYCARQERKKNEIQKYQ